MRRAHGMARNQGDMTMAKHRIFAMTSAKIYPRRTEGALARG